MIHISKNTISQMEKVERLNLINSCTGYKSANLIATKSESGESNVAIFSSITHLGSDPALLGFIMRPTTVPRDTYKNIKETGFFTVNHITLEEEYKNEIDFPFVKGSPIQLLCKYLNEYHIKENNTIHIVASIEHLFYDPILEHEKGWLQLDKVNVVSLNGLDGYCLPKLIDRFEYARKDTPTKSFFDK